MRFAELFDLISETQEVHLLFADCGILGTADSLGHLLNQEAFNATVVNVEAYGNKIKVWIGMDK